MRSSPGSSERDSRGTLFLDNLDMKGIEGDVLEKAVLSEVSPAFPLELADIFGEPDRDREIQMLADLPERFHHMACPG